MIIIYFCALTPMFKVNPHITPYNPENIEAITFSAVRCAFERFGRGIIVLVLDCRDDFNVSQNVKNCRKNPVYYAWTSPKSAHAVVSVSAQQCANGHPDPEQSFPIVKSSCKILVNWKLILTIISLRYYLNYLTSHFGHSKRFCGFIDIRSKAERRIIFQLFLTKSKLWGKF